MPLSADRCQVTRGPSPLKKAEAGSAVRVCLSEQTLRACVCPGWRYFVARTVSPMRSGESEGKQLSGFGPASRNYIVCNCNIE